MSIDSALIVRRAALPTTAELAAAIGQTGVIVIFPGDFRLDETPTGWVNVQVDGETSGFDYAVESLADLEEPVSAEVRKCGDTLLSFGARGALSAQTVSLIQRVMARHWKAAGWIEEELIPSAEMAKEYSPSTDIDPDLAATMQGTPAERAAAVERYVAKYYPPVPRDRRAEVMNYLKTLTIPLIVILIFVALFVWTRLT